MICSEDFFVHREKENENFNLSFDRKYSWFLFPAIIRIWHSLYWIGELIFLLKMLTVRPICQFWFIARTNLRKSIFLFKKIAVTPICQFWFIGCANSDFLSMNSQKSCFSETILGLREDTPVLYRSWPWCRLKKWNLRNQEISLSLLNKMILFGHSWNMHFLWTRCSVLFWSCKI